MRVDNASIRAAEGGSKAMLSSLSMQTEEGQEEAEEAVQAPFFDFFTNWLGVPTNGQLRWAGGRGWWWWLGLLPLLLLGAKLWAAGAEAMVHAGKRDLVGLSLDLDGELSLAQGVDTASVPMEVDPSVGLSLHGGLELGSRLIYAELVASLQAIGQRAAPSCGSAGIEGALCDEALSSGGLLDRSAEVAEAPLFAQPRLVGP